MSKNKNNAKRKGYGEKKEQEGRKVINWIFGILVALGALYAIYTIAIQ